MGNWLEGINGRIAAVGAIAASVVALNGQLTSCTTENINRHAAFRGAITAEETYWKGLFEQYAALVTEENSDLRDRKAFALAMLAGRPIPKFNEYRAAVFEDTTAIPEAQERFKALRDALLSALNNERISGREVAGQVQQQIQSLQNDPVASSEAVSSELAVVQDAIVRPDAEPTYDTLVRARGSQGGWDIDVFWCVDSRNQRLNRENYARAAMDANRLAVASTAGQPIVPGIKLGRIRLRPLPELRQGAGLPVGASGMSLRAEEKVSERNAANAVASLLNRSGGEYRIDRSQQSTDYYLSVFVCGQPASDAPSPTTQ